MDNKSLLSPPSPTPGKIPRVPSASRWGSSTKPINSLTQSSRQGLDTQEQLEVPKTALSPKGRPLSSNVYLKKTIAQGWKAQEVPPSELPPGELEKLVGDEVESLGEKKIALQGMLTSQSLVTGDQTAQQDWTKGEVKIPDFHCERCRDHFYGLTDELCDEETERIMREDILKRGKNDKDPSGSSRGRHPRGGGSRSPLTQHRRTETEVNTNKLNTTNRTTTSGINTQVREGESDLIGGDDNIESSDVTRKKGVKTGNKLSSEQEDDSSLVNTSTAKEFEQNKQINTNKQNTNTNKLSEKCDHDIIRDELTQDRIGTNLDSSHSKLNSGSQGVNIGSKEDRHGVGQGTGGTTSGGRRRKGGRKGQGGIGDGLSYSDTESDPDETGGKDRARRRRGRKGKGKREGDGSDTEESGSGQEGTESASRSRGVKNGNVSALRSTQNETTAHTGANGREGGGTHPGGQFNTSGHNESDTNTSHNRNRDTYPTGDIGIQIIDTGHKYHRGKGDMDDLDYDPLAYGTHPASTGRAATGTRRGQDDMSQLESSSQLLTKLLGAKRPATASLASSGYSFTLTQPYTFSYYKS